MAELRDIVVAVEVLLSTSSTILASEGYESAVNSALSELGWSLPNTNPTQIQWITKRSLRHACFILWVASAQKFKYKLINLQQRFDHYKILVESMDKEYETALAEQTDIFAGVDSYKLFGTAINVGFRYDYIGRDITYEDLERYINIGE